MTLHQHASLDLDLADAVNVALAAQYQTNAMNVFILFWGSQGVCPDQVRRIALAHSEAPGR
jgi:hypothetical protein